MPRFTEADLQMFNLTAAQRIELGLDDPPPETPEPEPPPADDDTEPSAPVTPALPVIHRPLLAKPHEPPTRAYAIIDAAMCLSGALNGAPLLERVPDGYRITLLPNLRLYAGLYVPAAVTLTWELRARLGWRTLSQERLPKVTPAEFGKLVVFIWLGRRER